MENSILYLYLKRVASGDKSYLERLCRKIADKIVYVPVHTEMHSLGEAEVVKVQVPCVKKAARKTTIPVFTSPEHFAAWCAASGHTNGSISLACGDLCLALDKESNVHIDPDSEHGVEIASRYKDLIVQALV